MSHFSEISPRPVAKRAIRVGFLMVMVPLLLTGVLLSLVLRERVPADSPLPIPKIVEVRKQPARKITDEKSFRHAIKGLPHELVGDPVTEIWLGETDAINDDLLAHLKIFPTLRLVRIDYTEGVTDAALAHLGELPDLENLRIHGTSVRGFGLIHLTKLKNLQTLSVPFDGNDVNAWTTLAGMPQLRSLDLGVTDTTDDALRNISRLQGLEEVILTNVGDDGLAQLKKLPDLKNLRIVHQCGVTEHGMKHFAEMTKLQMLRISGFDVTDSGLRHVAQLKDLRHLRLGHSITGDGLQHLAGLRELRELSLTGTILFDDALVHLKNLTKLQKLELSHTAITGEGLRFLSGLRKVEYLGLYEAQEFNDKGAAHLKLFTKLKDLKLSGTKITDAGLEDLSGLTSLEVLDLSCTRVSDAGIKHLASLRNLKLLDLLVTHVSEAAAKALHEKLPNVHIRGRKDPGNNYGFGPRYKR